MTYTHPFHTHNFSLGAVVGLSDVLLLNYNTDIEAYYIILTEVILKNEQRASVQFHLAQFPRGAYLQLASPY